MMSTRQQDERKEVFVSMLPNTLEALCSMQAAPHDDTILHHLLDVIRDLITSEDDAQRTGLLEFLNTVKEKAPQLSSAVLVLALGVAAHLASIASGAGNLWQSVISLFNVIQSSVVVGSSSVGTAYFNSLAKVLACPARLHWLENSSVHFRTALSTLETAQSIFLQNAAENFLLTCLTSSLEADGLDLMHSPPPSSMVVEEMKLLTSELTEMKRNRATLLDQMIVSSHVSTFHQSLVRIVCELTRSKAFCEWKAGDEAFVATLAHLALHHSSEKIQSLALQSVVSLVAFMGDKTKEGFLKKEIVSPLLKMMSEGGVERGVLVAAAFVKSSKNTDDSEALKTLEKLVHLPHDLLFGKQVHGTELTSLVSAITPSLCDQQRFSRLISSLLHSLKQSRNSEGLVRLVVSAGITRDDEDWLSALSSWPQGVGTVVINNHKLLVSLLDLLQQDSCLDLTMQQCTEVLMSLMRTMRRPLVDSRLYSQTCTAFLNILHRQYKCLDPEQTAGMEKVLTHWVGLMEYRLVSLQWEIRDTTLEHIQNTLGVVSDPWFHSALLDHHILRLAWSCTKHGESYPRASAISLVTSLTSSPLWDAFLQDADVTEASIADEMMEVLAKDSEAFPRRAAVLLLSALVSHCTRLSPTSPLSDRAVQRNKICAAMTAAMSDFDWDVKLKVLDFWEKLAAPLFGCEENVESENASSVNTTNQAVISNSKLHRKRTAPNQHSSASSKEYQMFETLLRDGFGKALLNGAEDYDLAVKQKALSMLVSIQRQMEAEDDSPIKAQKLHEESDIVKSVSVDVLREETPTTELTASPDKSAVSVFLYTVSQLDPAGMLQQQSQSADEYDRKPASLLEDVMAAVKQSTVVNEVTLMSEDEFEDADDMFVDCY